MNKLLIVLLAVCLVSVHAFVKRDAPAAAAPSPLQDIQKNFEEIAAKAKSIGEDLSKSVADAFQPDKVKKQLEDLASAASKAIDELKSKVEPAKPAA